MKHLNSRFFGLIYSYARHLNLTHYNKKTRNILHTILPELGRKYSFTPLLFQILTQQDYPRQKAIYFRRKTQIATRIIIPEEIKMEQVSSVLVWYLYPGGFYNPELSFCNNDEYLKPVPLFICFIFTVYYLRRGSFILTS